MNIKALGVQGIGIDSSVSTSCKSPFGKCSEGRTYVGSTWHPLVVLPAGLVTSQGLRDQARCHLGQNLIDGIPSLRGIDLKRVRSALYRLTGEVVKFCIDRGSPFSVENPALSHSWATESCNAPIRDVLDNLEETFFHHLCMVPRGENVLSSFIVANILVHWKNIVTTTIGTYHGDSTTESGLHMQRLHTQAACVKLMLLVSGTATWQSFATIGVRICGSVLSCSKS